MLCVWTVFDNLPVCVKDQRWKQTGVVCGQGRKEGGIVVVCIYAHALIMVGVWRCMINRD